MVTDDHNDGQSNLTELSDSFQEITSGFKSVRMVIIAAVAVGAGSVGLQQFNDPRPDPYTGTQGNSDRIQSVARDAAETEARRAEDTRLLERIQRNERGVENCQKLMASNISREHDRIGYIELRLKALEEKSME